MRKIPKSLQAKSRTDPPRASATPVLRKGDLLGDRDKNPFLEKERRGPVQTGHDGVPVPRQPAIGVVCRGPPRRRTTRARVWGWGFTSVSDGPVCRRVRFVRSWYGSRSVSQSPPFLSLVFRRGDAGCPSSPFRLRGPGTGPDTRERCCSDPNVSVG